MAAPSSSSPAPSSPSRTPRLVALFAAGWALLNFPLLTLWDRGATVLGLPLLPLAVFIGWAVLICVAAWVCESGAAEDD
jgi:hypothetical protein